MSTFVRFTENNDWEGETWHHYLRVDDNAAVLDSIEAAIDDSPEYELDRQNPLTLEQVNTLIAGPSATDYLPQHTKIDERLLPVAGADALYKGNIRDFIDRTVTEDTGSLR